MRDIMFYMEAQNKVGQSTMKEEIQQGEVVIGTPSNTTSPAGGASGGSGGGGRKKKRGGRNS